MTHLRNHFTAASEAVPVAANADDVEATIGSGNIFADLGFDNPAEEKLKADLVSGIAQEIERRSLSQTAAGRLIGLSQPDVSKLLRGRTGGFSLERLFAMTRALGSDVEVTVRRTEPVAAPARGRVNLRVLESA